MAVGRVAPSTNPPCQGTGWRKEVDSTNRAGFIPVETEPVPGDRGPTRKWAREGSSWHS